MNALSKLTFILIGCFVLGSCSQDPTIAVVDGKEQIARLTFKRDHSFFGEYDREITLSSEGKSRNLPYPPDTGGDTPIALSRHKDRANDLLRFQGGIYTLVFDLRTLDYAIGSDRPENEIYTGKYEGVPLPPVTASWTIKQDFRITKDR